MLCSRPGNTTISEGSKKKENVKRKAHVSRDKHAPSKSTLPPFELEKRSPTQIIRQLMTVKCLAPTPTKHYYRQNGKYFACAGFEGGCTVRLNTILREERKFSLPCSQQSDSLTFFGIFVVVVVVCLLSSVFGDVCDELFHLILIIICVYCFPSCVFVAGYYF